MVTSTNVLLSAYTSFLRKLKVELCKSTELSVNALSGLYLISTFIDVKKAKTVKNKCQCPLGLIPHFYRKRTPWVRWQEYCVNALSGLYLISTVPLQKPRFYAVSRACFCRYLSEYSDSSCFSCMLTFWTYLMRCTYPWHWIKYSTNYNRCHPIFFTLLISWAEQ